MQKERKSEAQIESERKEAKELTDRILFATNQIPKKILASGSHQEAVAFKKHALIARKVAEGKMMNLSKLRTAWSLISHYYA